MFRELGDMDVQGGPMVDRSSSRRPRPMRVRPAIAGSPRYRHRGACRRGQAARRPSPRRSGGSTTTARRSAPRSCPNSAPALPMAAATTPPSSGATARTIGCPRPRHCPDPASQGVEAQGVGRQSRSGGHQAAPTTSKIASGVANPLIGKAPSGANEVVSPTVAAVAASSRIWPSPAAAESRAARLGTPPIAA